MPANAEVQPGGTGAIATFPGGVKITNNTTAAAAGAVGEYFTQSRVRSAAASLTTGTVANVTAATLDLTAGDWDISGAVGFLPGATTSITLLFAGVSLTSATLPAGDTTAVNNSTGEYYTASANAAFVPSNNDIVLIIPSYRVILTGNTTFYLVSRGNFTTSTLTTYGMINARRVR
jgi:hypothetical protein